MRVEQGGIRDAWHVMEIITLCIQHMRARGIQQWDEIYPNLAVVEVDARSGSLFVLRQDGQCIAAVGLNAVQPEQYRPLPWRWCVIGSGASRVHPARRLEAVVVEVAHECVSR